MAGQENVAIVQGIYEAFGRGDLPAILERLAAHVSWRVHAGAPVPYGGLRTGKDAVAEWFGVLAAACEFQLFEPQRFLCDGDIVVVLGREGGRSRSSGRSFETAWAHVFTVRGGKITEFDDFFDSGTVGTAYGPER